MDTTGAGDLYAAGCARIGSIAAAEVIGHLGARPQAQLSELVEDAV